MKAPIPLVKLDKALEFFGGPKPLAEFLDVTDEAIYKLMRSQDQYLPSLRAFQIQSFYPELVEPMPRPSMDQRRAARIAAKEKAEKQGKSKSKRKTKAA